MTTSTQSVSTKSDKRSGEVLGRSAATGRFVLRPASKGSTITVREAKTAARGLSSSKKK